LINVKKKNYLFILYYVLCINTRKKPVSVFNYYIITTNKFFLGIVKCFESNWSIDPNMFRAQLVYKKVILNATGKPSLITTSVDYLDSHMN
jgi:hypothetical protein